MKTLVTILFITVSSSIYAQMYDKMFFAGWDFNKPLSNTEFIGKSSSRGIRLGYRELLGEQFTIGADVTWNSFDDYVPRQTYYSQNSTLTTDFTNYANNYGVTLAGEYYFFKEKKIMPYVGMGAGLSYNDYKVYYNVFSSGKNAIGALFRPQAGVWIKTNERKSLAFNACVHFDYSTARSKDLGYKYFTGFGFQIGIVYLDW